MKIGDKVIITGGTQKDWHKHGKPYYSNLKEFIEWKSENIPSMQLISTEHYVKVYTLESALRTWCLLSI